jgi:dihydrofolate synthase/folylpolyglutamate synthase
LIERLLALETFGIKLGLENITRLCEALGHPERSFIPLHVAGTNGKGSVTAMVHAALVAAGIRAARYTSPHLSHLAERFVIGRHRVEEPALLDAIDTVLAVADRLRAEGTLSVLPTFFEATTAVAFELFRRAGTAVAVIEVGLGGRFDATNVVQPAVGAITTIGFDHQQHLGHTLEAIAFEKAGIIKPGMTVVAGALPPAAQTVVRRAAEERGARLVWSTEGAHVETRMDDGRARVTITTERGTYGPVALALRGEHQVMNALVAVRMLEASAEAGVIVPREAVECGLERAEWPARLELLRVSNGRTILLDAAHNAEGAKALADYVTRWCPEPPPLVASIMRDKDIGEILRTLVPAMSTVFATAAPTPRALAPDQLAAAAARAGAREVVIEPDPMTAVARALEQAPLACVAGSIFLVGPIREALEQRARQS